MESQRYGVLRDWSALAVAAVSCPVAVFGGTNLGCVGQGLSSSCALTAVWISPLLLIGAGVITGLITRGWTGLFAVAIGVILGMTSILVLSAAAGRPVPVDWFSGLVATAWFGAPIAIGYGLARAGRWIVGRRTRGGTTLT